MSGVRSGSFEVIPAIDLRGGRCVRLVQGDYARETVYADDPAAQAAHWRREGAARLHVVDLDGARDGALANASAIAGIVRAVDVPVQVGGGVRELAAAARLFELGVDRVVVGTAAVRDPPLLERLAERYPGRIALGLDARDGRVATAGWREASGATSREVLERFRDLDLACAICTDIARDGMLVGPDTAGLAALVGSTRLAIIASGGVARVEDVDALVAAGVRGMIVGKALYEGALALPALLARAVAVGAA